MIPGQVVLDTLEELILCRTNMTKDKGIRRKSLSPKSTSLDVKHAKCTSKMFYLIITTCNEMMSFSDLFRILPVKNAIVAITSVMFGAK